VRHLDPDARRAGRVPEHVRQALLDDAVDGELQRGVVRQRRPLHVQRDRQAGRRERVDEPAEVADGRVRCQRRARHVVGGLAGLGPERVLPQHADHPAGVGQRLAPRAGEPVEGRAGALGIAAERAVRAVREGDHDGQRVGEDVVHLPGDAVALGADGELLALVALQCQASGAVLELDDPPQAVAHVRPDERRQDDDADAAGSVQGACALAAEHQRARQHVRGRRARGDEKDPAPALQPDGDDEDRHGRERDRSDPGRVRRVEDRRGGRGVEGVDRDDRGVPFQPRVGEPGGRADDESGAEQDDGSARADEEERPDEQRLDDPDRRDGRVAVERAEDRHPLDDDDVPRGHEDVRGARELHRPAAELAEQRPVGEVVGEELVRLGARGDVPARARPALCH
jgi:hypothetical protein